MRDVVPWDRYLMSLAYLVASRSKDPNTQVGAVIVDEQNRILATGYNGFAPGIAETAERWERPVKYDYVIHAEINAIAHAASKGISLHGSTLYVTHAPCMNCFKTVIASGIRKVVTDQMLAGWEKEQDLAIAMARESGVIFTLPDLSKPVASLGKSFVPTDATPKKADGPRLKLINDNTPQNPVNA